MSGALYNEIEPFAASWIEQLIAGGHIAAGTVERRSIAELTPADVAGPGQRHFFAGIGVWSYALRLAGVPDDISVWTGSCPCQPFSAAGKRRGAADERHLWPTWFALIRECRPAIVFGEQVASPDGLAWLDAVYADLEGAGYSVGAADLCAAGVGAPHRRQRLYFVAYAGERGREVLRSARIHDQREPRLDTVGRSAPRELVNATGGSGGLGLHAGPQGPSDVGRPSSRSRGQRDAAPGTQHRGLGDASRDGNLEHARELRRDEIEHEIGAEVGDHASVFAGAVRGFWADAEWVPCRDPVSGGIVYRPVEPGTFPLAHGATARVGRLRGYGNAIVPQVAATFIEAALDAYATG